MLVNRVLGVLQSEGESKTPEPFEYEVFEGDVMKRETYVATWRDKVT